MTSHRPTDPIDDDPAPPATAEDYDTAFGTEMQPSESDAEPVGDPTPNEKPPAPTPPGTSRDDAASAAALTSYNDSQPQPPTTEPLVDPLGEAGRAYR